MQFALTNFSFDTLTIVDSDQLSIRKSYSSYVGKYFKGLPDVGMLSSNPERVTMDTRTNFVAWQAYKEYELWKPFLTGFAGGEEKFVHWTFWPSSVFTADAARDLVHIFKENEQLKEIMQRSKIWATEEVILPTLVSLMGYKIAANPCSYDFVRFRKPIWQEDIYKAAENSNAYWVHPIVRKYEDPIRKLIRNQAGEYMIDEASTSASASHLPILPVINSIKDIQGWLSDKEAELFFRSCVRVCKVSKPEINIVEIGSYHGKSTVILGTIVMKLYPDAGFYAIDPHDGKLGAEDQGLKSFPSSFEIFKKNLENKGVSDVVKIIRDYSYNVKWEKPVSLLFIDGLHDYKNVARDFEHFEKWIVLGGYIIFHDYADYWPGVKVFVDALLETGKYKKIQLADSLMVVEKM
jgi:predicted O-methyltransferase YrrM